MVRPEVVGVAAVPSRPAPLPPRSDARPAGGRPLFSFAQPANAAALDAALPAPTHVIHYVRLNRALIEGKRSPFWQRPGAGAFDLPLGDGAAARVVIDRSEMLGADRFTSVGHLAGQPQSQVVLAYDAGFLNGSIEDPAHGTFALRSATAEFSQFYRIDPALVPPCGGERHPTITAATLAAAAARRARQAELAGGAATAGTPPTAGAVDNPQHADVTVLMLYTQAVLPTLSGDTRTAALQSVFDAAIAKTNAAFAASLVTARVRLVKIAETQYDETKSDRTKVQDDALTALQSTTDGMMDEIHALRDAVGADMVCLALNRSDSLSIGLSFVLDTPGANMNPLFAFSVVQYSTIAGTNVVPHELGHQFGCVHDRENASGPGAYPYSYGYRFVGANGVTYHDIMSYPPGQELSYFANPNVVVPAPVSVPIGIAPGQPGEADTALTIEQDAFEVSTYRLQTPAPPNLGALVDVATRAYVGTGDQVLIGGFIVGGPDPKRILVRAVGPTLAGFGVAAAVRDPALRLFAGATVIATNDNWGTPAGGAADLATAAAQVGAFPLPTGSADAAILATLAPGAYTAVVDGVDGATGLGLVEAYDVDRGPNRIVNLATRAFADRAARPMIGGFVVQGDAGTTKRILIRALGPTLARDFGIANAMDDPTLELHNAAGDQIVFNDDWSSGNQAHATGAANDFHPLVALYSEQAIAATGFAPPNRREPCVLADLPPGSYTVMVKPFEFRSQDPTLDEPAQPGVATVEVYEIR